MRLKRLSAAQEVGLHHEAWQGYKYLCFQAKRELSQQEKERFWAAANNAALLSLALWEDGKNVFSDTVDVLKHYSLLEIADKTQEYQEKFEEEYED